jgi:hypothetical protein
VLGREDVVEHGHFIEVAIFPVRCLGKEVFCEFEHVISVAALRAICHGNVMVAITMLYKVLVDAVAA